MNPLVVFAVAIPAAFAAGVIFHKYVVSEAAAIKDHVTAEIENLRIDVASVLAKAASKV